MTLYAVPNDEVTPFPVDFDRMVHALKDMGYQVDIIVEGRAAGAVFDKVPMLFSFDSSGRFLSVRSMWETTLCAESYSAHMFAILDGWNREKYFPTLYWMPTDSGTVQVCADFAVDTRAGLSVAQLQDNLGAGISTGISAIEYAREAVEECLGICEDEADGEGPASE